MTDRTPGEAEARIVERSACAHDLVRPYEGRPGVLGAFVHGSSVRPYGDARSDLDIGVVVADDTVAAELAGSEVHRKIWVEGRKLADLSLYPAGSLASPPSDLEHFRAMYARVLFEDGGQVTALLDLARALPPAMAAERLRVHYFEVTNLMAKARSAQQRGHDDIAALLRSQLVVRAGRLLAVSRGVWPSPTTWMFEELSWSGVPAPLLASLRALPTSAEPRQLRTLRGALDEYLLAQGIAFVADPGALLEWIYGTPAGRSAVAAWGWELG